LLKYETSIENEERAGMKIDLKMIAHLEALARIELTPEERTQLTEQLDRIVGFCEQLQEIDTENIEPTSAVVHESRLDLRADKVEPGLKRDVILGEAPDAENGFFRVPKIIER
jgi:aspartyl-tRNA(Asn)/glutamyl-tRNA(Gln) amidotransferase subunit C